MIKPSCDTCGKTKAPLACGLCNVSLCKSCARFLSEDEVSFLSPIPPDLSHGCYCSVCFDARIAPAVEAYNQKMEQARQVAVYLKKQGKETRLIKRLEETVLVSDCADYEEAILRLAFLSVGAGCNALVDVELRSQKVQNGSYQKLKWSASGSPANIKAEHLVRDRSIWQNPN